METRRAELIVAQLLEADPDDVDPRVALKKLPGYRWIVSFEGAIGTDGVPIELVVHGDSLDYPVIAVAKEDAVEMARDELIKAGYGMDNATLIGAMIAEPDVWNDLKLAWNDLTQQDIDSGKYGQK